MTIFESASGDTILIIYDILTEKVIYRDFNGDTLPRHSAIDKWLPNVVPSLTPLLARQLLRRYPNLHRLKTLYMQVVVPSDVKEHNTIILQTISVSIQTTEAVNLTANIESELEYIEIKGLINPGFLLAKNDGFDIDTLNGIFYSFSGSAFRELDYIEEVQVRYWYNQHYVNWIIKNPVFALDKISAEWQFTCGDLQVLQSIARQFPMFGNKFNDLGYTTTTSHINDYKEVIERYLEYNHLDRALEKNFHGLLAQLCVYCSHIESFKDFYYGYGNNSRMFWYSDIKPNIPFNIFNGLINYFLGSTNSETQKLESARGACSI